MTAQRRNGEDTPLKGWIRNHPALDSGFGYVATDVDLTWYNYKKALIMLLEHKEYMAVVGAPQESVLAVLDQALTWGLSDPSKRLVSHRIRIPERVHYCGLHTIRCEHTSPLDGDVYIDDVRVTNEELLSFLKFEWTPVIKVYHEQKERLLISRTLQDLKVATDFVASTIYAKHPEAELLREIHKQKKYELTNKPMKQQLKQKINIGLAQIQQLQKEKCDRCGEEVERDGATICNDCLDYIMSEY